MKTRSFGREYAPIEYSPTVIPLIPAHERASVESVVVSDMPDYVAFGRKVHIVRDRRAFEDTEAMPLTGA